MNDDLETVTPAPDCDRAHADDGEWIKGPGPGWRVMFVEDGDFSVVLPGSAQAVALFPGDNMGPWVLTDSDDRDAMPTFPDVRARVLAARLRYWAEVLEAAGRPKAPAVP